jgi:uncharacterized Zn finger protein
MARWYSTRFSPYPASRPRTIRGGIKARTQRGSFGASWWARRWIEVLESFHVGARLARGRAYARRGQVVSIDIEKGRVKAVVQGSRISPYTIRIEIETFTRAELKKLAQVLSRNVAFAARLLNGEMPENIEEAFDDAGLSLFPRRQGDLKTACSCPDWSNPCKHIAAVYYLLGEEFDRDPFLILKLRGLAREELPDLVGGAKPGVEARGRKAHGSDAAATSGLPIRGESLPADPGLFWGQTGAGSDPDGDVSVPAVSAALVKRLGHFPFWRGRESLLGTLERIYREASLVGLDVFLGELGAPETPRSTDSQLRHPRA